MKVKTIPSSWMRRDGRRLDCGPYMSGALEAKIRLEEEMSCRKNRFADPTVVRSLSFRPLYPQPGKAGTKQA